jgi:hypothetical protein
VCCHVLISLQSALHGELGNEYIILVGNSVLKRLGRPRCRREDNIKMNQGSRVGGCGLDSSGSG